MGWAALEAVPRRIPCKVDAENRRVPAEEKDEEEEALWSKQGADSIK